MVKVFFQEVISKVAYWLPGFISGGIAVVIAIINNKFVKDQKNKQTELDKELELFRNKIQNKNYVSKIRLDAEFQLYRELSVACYDMFLKVRNLSLFDRTTPKTKDERQDYKTHVYNPAYSKYIAFDKLLTANSAFIPIHLYEEYEKFLLLNKRNLDIYTLKEKPRFLVEWKNDDETKYEKHFIYVTNDDLDEGYNNLVNIIRNYLSNLEVLD